MRKKTVIKGVAILMTANLITRLMGFYYRTCMVKMIGAEGVGLYQLIMPLYMLSWSITSSGITTTVSKLTAEETAKNNPANAKRVLHTALFLSFYISVSLALGMYIFAEPLAKYVIHDIRTTLPLKILSLSIPFMALGSCSRGYFMGTQNQVYPAASQIIEQIVRILAIFSLASHFVSRGLEYACAAATLGIVLGEAISFLFTIVSLKFSLKNITKKPSLRKRKALIVLLSMAVPLTLSRVTGSMLATIESILIPQRLSLYPSGENALATFGSLTGMAMPLIQLPSAILFAVSVTLVPALSETEAIGKKKETSFLIEKALCWTSIIGWGVTVIFASFPKEICSLIYGYPNLGDMLFKLCIICPFLYLNITLAGVLNGLGCHTSIFKLNIISSAINIVFIYFLMPKIGIDAFIIGTAISLMVVVGLEILTVSRKNPFSISFYKSFFTPAVCAVSSYIIIKLFPSPKADDIIIITLYIIFLGLIYLLLLLAGGGITKNDILSLFPRKNKA